MLPTLSGASFYSMSKFLESCKEVEIQTNDHADYNLSYGQFFELFLL